METESITQSANEINYFLKHTRKNSKQSIPEEGIKIELPFSDHLKRRNSIKEKCHITLYDKHVEYKIITTYEELCEDTDIWKDRKANYRFTRLRKDMSNIGMYYDNDYDMWAIDIEWCGVANSCTWLHESPKEILSIYNQLQDYLINQ